jgi:hypothetical protein
MVIAMVGPELDDGGLTSRTVDADAALLSIGVVETTGVSNRSGGIVPTSIYSMQLGEAFSAVNACFLAALLAAFLCPLVGVATGMLIALT